MRGNGRVRDRVAKASREALLRRVVEMLLPAKEQNLRVQRGFDCVEGRLVECRRERDAIDLCADAARNATQFQRCFSCIFDAGGNFLMRGLNLRHRLSPKGMMKVLLKQRGT